VDMTSSITQFLIHAQSLYRAINTSLIADPVWSYIAASFLRLLLTGLLLLCFLRLVQLLHVAWTSREPLLWRLRWPTQLIALNLLVVAASVTLQILAGQAVGSPTGYLTAYMLGAHLGLAGICFGLAVASGRLRCALQQERGWPCAQ
jgi:hypothetical protein